MKINLACGNAPLEGWLNVDISPSAKADQVMDLLKFPWPWENVEELNASHFLEHIGDEFIPFMDEAYRVLAPGGKFTIEGPYYTSVRCWQDPTHKRALSEILLSYFDKDFREKNGVGHYPITANFKVKHVQYICGPEVDEIIHEKEQFEWLRLHAWNVVQDFKVELVKE